MGTLQMRMLGSDTAPALWDDVYLVAGPWQPGREQDQCSGDTGANALVLDAPTTPVNTSSSGLGEPWSSQYELGQIQPILPDPGLRVHKARSIMGTE